MGKAALVALLKWAHLCVRSWLIQLNINRSNSKEKPTVFNIQ